jgi:hypothetical protein
VSEIAYKVVGSDLVSAFAPWRVSRIPYEVGGFYDAQGLSGAGVYDSFPDLIDIRDPRNRLRGIVAFTSLDCWWLTSYAFALNRGATGPGAPARYLQLEYEIADVLNPDPDDGDRNEFGASWGACRALSLASVHVSAEVFP